MNNNITFSPDVYTESEWNLMSKTQTFGKFSLLFISVLEIIIKIFLSLL